MLLFLYHLEKWSLTWGLARCRAENGGNQCAVDPSPGALPANLDLWLVHGCVVIGEIRLWMSLLQRQMQCERMWFKSVWKFIGVLLVCLLRKNIYLIRVLLRIRLCGYIFLQVLGVTLIEIKYKNLVLFFLSLWQNIKVSLAVEAGVWGSWSYYIRNQWAKRNCGCLFGFGPELQATGCYHSHPGCVS